MPSEKAADPALILAAGGVLWRPSTEFGMRIAIVHRPRYNDWSLPKGKADFGETMPAAAVREIAEETGFGAVLGREVFVIRYGIAAGTKVVHFYSARALEGEFVANGEVDSLEWSTPDAARTRLTHTLDRRVLDRFLQLPTELSVIVLVRHARAGHRESFLGPDGERPLDAKGLRQAAALTGELRPFFPAAVSAVPIERCLATVAPLAANRGLPTHPEPALSEESYRDDPAAARRRLLQLAAEPVFIGPTSAVDGSAVAGARVIVSQGGVIPGVIKSLAARSRIDIAKGGTAKASYWVLTFGARRLVQADHFAAPAV